MFWQLKDTVIVSSDGVLSNAETNLPPEEEEGNIEYKLKLIDKSPERIEQLATQMKWRLSEGNGEALYEIGISDNGMLVGLTKEELDASMVTLKTIAEKLSADCSIIRQRVLTSLPTSNEKAIERSVMEVLVRKRVKEEHFLEVRVGILGSSDAGKTTLLGVLLYSELDNGHGRARSRGFNHVHELTTGRTSSLSYDIIGFDSSGNLINYASNNIQKPQQICEEASKIITLIDTCGLPKYFSTTLAGVSAYQPHYAMLMVNAKQFTGHEHLGMLIALKIPIFVVVTKIDQCHEDIVKSTLQELISILNGPGRRLMPYIIKNEDDLVVVLPHFSFGRVIPVFLVSSVTGENISLLTKFLNLLPQPVPPNFSQLVQQDLEFQLHDVYQVPEVNTVVGGHVLAGHLQLRRFFPYFVGPFEDGLFHPIQITSIHRFCRPVQFIKANQSATLAVACAQGPLRRGMVILTSPSSKAVVWEFDVQLHMLYHATSLKPTQTALIFCGSIKQAAKVIWMERTLKTGDQCRVRFRFINHVEWLKPGMSMFAREGSAGRMKCVGTILDISPHEPVSH